MSKRHHKENRNDAARKLPSAKWMIVFTVIAAAAVAITLARRKGATPTAAGTNATPQTATANTNLILTTNEVAQALMVTVDLDFGGPPPTIKEALKFIERRHQPDDRAGRTFAILDAYGEPTPDGKLHMSMHVSMEKPGIGSLVFTRTGQELWKARINAAKTPPPEKNLTIIMDHPDRGPVMLDGSKGAKHVLDVPLQSSTTPVRDVWPDGSEREFTFIYSACGCPVKTKVRRMGDTTARTTEMPVMFPDDPAAMDLINSLMGWPATH